MLLVAIGIAAPVLIWFAYANSTGSPLAPTKNHENLALTYFAEGDRVTGDPRLILAERFTSTRQVLAEDPQRIARIYVADLYDTTRRLLILDTVLPRPVIAISVLCWLVILIRERRNRAMVAVLLLNLVGMYLLLNFKAYEHRYYLYFVPFFGVSIGYVFALAFNAATTIRASAFLAAILPVAIGLAAYNAIRGASSLHLAEWSDDAYAAAQYLESAGVPSDTVIVARKSHVAHYAGTNLRFIPQDTGADKLVDYLRDAQQTAAAPVFVFFGIHERQRRPDLSSLAEPEARIPDELRMVASGPEKNGWFLYELKHD